MSSYSTLLGLIIIMLVVSFFSSYAGYSVGGVPQGGAEIADSSGLLQVVTWVWESIQFLFSMMSFQVDDMPVFISGIFLVMGLMTVFIIVRLVRGNA